MDKSQLKTLAMFGYAVAELPGKPIPRMTFYKADGTPLENLLADAYHMKRYLERGFTIAPPEKKEESSKLNKTLTADKLEFVCETCGKGFSKKVALVGHSRSHKKEVLV